MATPAADWQRLGRIAKDRREYLGLSQLDVQASGGPSTASLRLIEGGLQAGYRSKTLRDLEDALGWQRGSVRSILDGGDPAEKGPSMADVPIPDSPITIRSNPAQIDPRDPASLRAIAQALELLAEQVEQEQRT